MSQQDAVRSGDDVLRELVQLDHQVKHARAVLILEGEARPRLLAELNARIEPLGLKCVPAVDESISGCGGACSAKAPCKSFSDITLAPVAHEMQLAPVAEIASLAEVAPVMEVAQPFTGHAEAIVPAPKPVERLDMSKPINWKLGDVFTENPRFTLVHQRREWALDGLDIANIDKLQGVDVEIHLVGAGDESHELMTIQQFMAGYVFVRRPQSAD